MTPTNMDDFYTSISPSKSNEYTIINDATGNASNIPPPGTGTLAIVASSNNDFVCLKPSNISLSFGGYLINNDYTNENTNYGNADAKHITPKISFGQGKFAEDLIVYLTAYRPSGTDIKVFARIQNSGDPDAFDDKDWTLLQIIDGDIYSSSTDQNDYIEMTYNFPQYPNTAFTLNGSVNLNDTANVIITGSGTSFQSNTTANLQVNDLVKIYSPLFPSDHYNLSVVSSVANDTYFTITDPIANSGLIGSGLKVDLIGRQGNSTVAPLGYPAQAFNNTLNDNVVRYFSSSMSAYDTFDNMQIKIVLLSDSNLTSAAQLIPRVDDIRAVGVSA
jgi:hypothetical protein